RLPAAKSALEGTQPLLRQSPPIRAFSTSTTGTLRVAAAIATDSPPAPAPMTQMSGVSNSAMVAYLCVPECVPEIPGAAAPSRFAAPGRPADDRDRQGDRAVRSAIRSPVPGAPTSDEDGDQGQESERRKRCNDLGGEDRMHVKAQMAIATADCQAMTI